MIKRKLQVFVSSTYLDLKEERQAAVEAILEAGHIPAGMELFSAGNKSQLDTIYRWIKECDAYMLLLGGRYGSLETETGLSYTELEFNFALGEGKPHFSLVISDAALERRVRERGSSVLEVDNNAKYVKFKSRVESYIRSEFDDVKDIKLNTIKSLKQYEADDRLPGWISGRNFSEGMAERIDFLESRIFEYQAAVAFYEGKYKEAQEENAKLRRTTNKIGLATYVTSGRVTPAISELALELLFAAASSSKALILVSRTISGTDFMAGEKKFGRHLSQREVARHEAAIDELVNEGLISASAVGTGVYQVTHRGFKKFDELAKLEPKP